MKTWKGILFTGSLLTLSLVSNAQTGDYPIQPVPFTDVKVTDHFWAPRIQNNHKVTIPIALKQCYLTGRIDNFLIAGGWKKGKFQSEYPFDDSDLFKIIEGASYSLQTIPDAEMNAHLDALIYYIGKAQEPDGYLYTNRTIDPNNLHAWVGKKRWENDWDLSHELYNLGHLYEAAAAHFQATAKRSLLDIAIKSADLLCTDFGPGKLAIVPGHQVVEMGLVKLYRVTGEQKYLDLAHYFLSIRGKNKEKTRGEYCQDHIPVEQQTTAVGHAVRACYMYSGMADIAAIQGEKSYQKALNQIWDNIIEQKYYITGGIGAAGGHEGFGEPYDLPNMSAYNETCASIGEVFWNYRMFLLEGNSKYYDVLERTLYNGTVSGVSLTGDRFFYPNPLESKGQHARSEWFGCACCPSNVCRFIPSIPGYFYAKNKDRLYINLFANSEASVQLETVRLAVAQKTDYPWDGHVEIALKSDKAATYDVAIRIPGWARNEVVPSDLYRFTDKSKENAELYINNEKIDFKIENGYAIVHRNWGKEDVVKVILPMEPRRIVANDQIKADRGKVALQRGPIVYCLEWPDNDNKQVRNILLPPKAKLASAFQSDLLDGVEIITADAYAVQTNEKGKQVKTKQKVTAIPYYAWANRGSGEMEVWIASEETKVKATPRPSIASTSKVTASKPTAALSSITDQCDPTSSKDSENPYYHWWPEVGSKQWIQYDFAKPTSVSEVKVYWFDDAPFGGCRVPKEWKLLYKTADGSFAEVKTKGEYGVEKDKYNILKFSPVTTSTLKLEVQLPEKQSSGVHEWIVNE
ncbi:MAG: glycoside hydrolase family 127 protein [Bacteroidales bacterium]|nr:glycoside hydrolase family 127 protein [Bacteroidales bacterium]